MSSIKLSNVDLVYRIQKEVKFKDLLLNLRGSRKNETSKGKYIHALKDFTLSLNEGDRLGIIGHNGAGKSSLLKLIAGIYPPTKGSFKVDGHVACLFELATGFEMEATGWDNIYLRGLMLGETPQTIRKKMDAIAEFSELGDYLNIPVKYYSSGMFIRLAFSISTAIEPDILLLDEVMAAGDAGFLEKAERRMKELMDKVKILVFVSHSMDSIRDFCNKCVWLEHGKIKMVGNTEETIQAYLASYR
ncbi:ABC transporter ATP-binding protein [Aneurinibacillus tyrosinisolvens]|uniref:ABC transporter ATP-binding protein n=1 Tax=Aneurinibacillus tyrosinisolvens TaxID=1443435 RepID=UPI00063F1088|nr:ABC transporter ATP-binding protein [Aneurinibacillus tyrosinisolvens]